MAVDANEVFRRVEEAATSGSLDLSELKLTEVPPGVATLTELTELRLDGNHLDE